MARRLPSYADDARWYPVEREDVHRRATFAEADSERGQSFEIIDLIVRMQRQKSGRAARVSERAPKRNRAEKQRFVR